MNKNKELEKRTRVACCNIYKDRDKMILELEMPGVSKDNLDVNIDHNILKVHGVRNRYGGSENEKGEFLIREIRSDDYYQEFTIDDTIDRDKVTASIIQGVVRVELQMKESVLPRKITIN